MNLVLSTFLDILIVAIVGLSIFFGVRRGLIRTAIHLFGSIIALVLALIFSAPLGEYIDTNYVNTPMREWTVNQLTVGDDPSVTDVDFDGLFSDRASFLVETCEFLGVDVDEMNRSYQQLKADGLEQAKSAILAKMVDPLSSVISRAIAFGVIFLAAIVAIVVISLFSKFLNHLPIVRKMNKLGGGILGGITGVLLALILVAIFSTASKYVLKDSTPEERTEIRDNTIVYKIFYNVNPLNGLFDTAD
ncbi:MAG: CvpA family protein [Clostridia bacterium]|nr:CvpA family protein [Clostridia bacterium]